MRPEVIPLGLIAFLGWVMVMPALQHYITTHTGDLPLEVQFLFGLTVPAAAVIFLAGWIQP